MNTPLSIGTKIMHANKVWTVVSCGNGFYGVRREGMKQVFTIHYAEAQADIKAGIASVLAA